MDSLNFAEHPARPLAPLYSRPGRRTDPSCFLLFRPVSPRTLPRPCPSFPTRRAGGFKAEALSPLFHGVTTHPSSLLRPSDAHRRAPRRAHIPPRSFLLTLAFSRAIPPSPFSPQSEDQLEWLGVLRVPAIIPRQSLISTSAISTLPAPTTPVA